jgi:hypothetical protein
MRPGDLLVFYPTYRGFFVKDSRSGTIHGRKKEKENELCCVRSFDGKIYMFKPSSLGY